MTIEFKITKYDLQYFAFSGNEADHTSKITFYNELNQKLGEISFYKEGQTIPNNMTFPAKFFDQVLLRTTKNQMPGILDMLRNEKPCSVYYSSSTVAYVRIGTEPIDEEES